MEHGSNICLVPGNALRHHVNPEQEVVLLMVHPTCICEKGLNLIDLILHLSKRRSIRAT
jgi:hypothetical protein